jgi:glycosyltransferase involved in cell wall biosynthesis
MPPTTAASTEPACELRVAYLATQGNGSGDEARIADLLAPLRPTQLRFDRSRKARSYVSALGGILRERPDVVVMEGTGVAGGATVVTARVLLGVPFVFSSGDAVGPYLGLINPWLAAPGRLYERMLCKLSIGYIGWSPYLVGRAITLGARRGMTAAHWSAVILNEQQRVELRAETRRRLGISENELVVGLVGSLKWNPRRSYTYGLELVDAVRRTSRADVRIVIVGAGDGTRQLALHAGEDLGRRILLVGAVPRMEVVRMLCAMDVASLPQSLDEVGALRYTTKLSEYLGAGVPVVTGQLPVAYDLDDGWLWRIAGAAPWDPQYLAGMTRFLTTLDPADVAARQARVPRRVAVFDFARQQRAVSAFVTEAARTPGPPTTVHGSEEGFDAASRP